MNITSDNNSHILASSLFQLCSQLSSGTLFIKTHHYSSAQIILEDGVVTSFAFDNKNGTDAIEDFKSVIYWKTQFIENYEFPLTTAAKIKCSNCLLSELGFNEYLIDKTFQSEKQLHYKCAKPESLESKLFSFSQLMHS